MRVNIVETLIVGVALVVIGVPFMEKSLARNDIDLNGLMLNGIEAIKEAVSRNTTPVSEPSPEGD